MAALGADFLHCMCSLTFQNDDHFSAAEMSQIGARSLYFDVTGEARNERVKMPNCILGGKPGALPNTPVSETQ